VTAAASSSDSSPVVRVLNLRKSYSNNEVLKGITFELRKSEVLSVIGASGSGKSTMLKCVNHLETPSSGEIWINGRPMGFEPAPNGRRRPASQQTINMLRRDVGMVFQHFNLWPHMTVLENIIEAPVHVLKESRKVAVDRALLYLEKVNLSDKKDEYPSRLSGGQQQRVAIARALNMQPKVMLFDEPTSSLDPELIGEVLDVMKRLAQEGMTMIVVTHEMGFAREASDRLMFLHDGIIEEQGTPTEVLTSARSERCRQFLSKVLT
jgi:ABC-type histidine transport system ATPase subunit